MYRLEGKVAIPIEDSMDFVKSLSAQDRQVALTETEDYAISTVFLGVDLELSKKLKAIQKP